MKITKLSNNLAYFIVLKIEKLYNFLYKKNCENSIQKYIINFSLKHTQKNIIIIFNFKV